MVVFNATLHVPNPQNPCVVMNMLSYGLFKRKKYVGLRVCDFEETKERNETDKHYHAWPSALGNF